MQYLPKPCRWAGMTSMLVIGAVHLLVIRQAFDDAGYKGLLFLVVVICAFFAAMGIQEGALIRGWELGSLVAGMTCAGLIANGTVGMPGLPANAQMWQEPMGLIALAAEILMLAAALWALLAARRTRHAFAA
jgi:hypothetical protein